MEFHELASIFPLMVASEYDALKADMAQHGLRQPITRYHDKIVDGRNRYKACKELGIEPRFQEWDGKGDLLAFIVSQNLHRRHLNESQRAVIASQLANMKRGEFNGNKYKAAAPHKVSQANAAALFNVSLRVVCRMKIVQREAPDLLPRIMDNTMTADEAVKQVRERLRFKRQLRKKEDMCKRQRAAIKLNIKNIMTDEWLQKMYIDEGLRGPAIAKIIGCSFHTVTRYLRKYGIPITPSTVQVCSEEKRKKISEVHKGRHLSPEHRERISKALKGENHPNYGKHQSREHRDKQSATQKAKWKDEEFVAKMMIARCQYPNHLETVVLDSLKRINSNEWEYNGNFEQKIMIGGMIPDFININHKKIIIEVFGDYWHSSERTKNQWKRTEFGRCAAYSQLGYKCVVLWEQEISSANDLDAYITEKILNA